MLWKSNHCHCLIYGLVSHKPFVSEPQWPIIYTISALIILMLKQNLLAKVDLAEFLMLRLAGRKFTTKLSSSLPIVVIKHRCHGRRKQHNKWHQSWRRVEE